MSHRFQTILGNVPDRWSVISLRCALSRSAAGDWGNERGEVSLPVLRSTNFTSERHLDFSSVRLRGFSTEEASRFDIRAGDILVERSGIGSGRVVCVEEDLPDHGFSNFVQLLRVDELEMCADYVAWCLYQLHASGLIERLLHQTSIRNLDFRDYLRIVIPRPPRPEQEAIARRISSADGVARSMSEQLAATTRLRNSLLQTLFSKGLPGLHKTFQAVTLLREHYEIPVSWRFERLGKYLCRVDYGTNAASNDTVGWPVVAIPQVTSPVLSRGHWPFAAVSRSEAEQLFLEGGDVLLVRTNGNPKFIGKATLVPDELANEEIVFASYLIRVRPKTADLLGAYLNFFLASPLGRRQLVAVANTSAGNHNLAARALKQIMIPLPSTDEQGGIIARISAVDRYSEAIQRRISAAQTLKQSLLQNLLNGRARVCETIVA